MRRDVAAYARGRGCGIGVKADAGQHRPQPSELTIFGTEVVPPLADAVRFVDRHELHVALGEPVDEPVTALAGQTFRRYVEQPIAAFAQAGRDRVLLVRAQRAVVESRRDTVADEGVDLILHQGDERRYDDAEARADERRRLEAERLAAAGGHHDDRVATFQDGVHGLPLQGPKRGVAPVAFENLAEVSAGRAGVSGEWKHSDALDHDERALGGRLAEGLRFGVLR